MNIQVNGETVSVEDGCTVADAVETRVGAIRGIAVAVDRVVVPRSAWGTTQLHEGSQVEVLAAAAGG